MGNSFRKTGDRITWDGKIQAEFTYKEKTESIPFGVKLKMTVLGARWEDLNQGRMELAAKALLIVAVTYSSEVFASWNVDQSIIDLIIMGEYIVTILLGSCFLIIAALLKWALYSAGLLTAAEVPCWGMNLKITSLLIFTWVGMIKLLTVIPYPLTFLSSIFEPGWENLAADGVSWDGGLPQVDLMKSKAKVAVASFILSHHLIYQAWGCGCISLGFITWPPCQESAKKAGYEEGVLLPARSPGWHVHKLTPHHGSGPTMEEKDGWLKVTIGKSALAS